MVLASIKTRHAITDAVINQAEWPTDGRVALFIASACPFYFTLCRRAWTSTGYPIIIHIVICMNVSDSSVYKRHEDRNGGCAWADPLAARRATPPRHAPIIRRERALYSDVAAN
ncbi:hypothetical protein EVAR_51019_1 [Eumeta japonica]|uniref:Uncharacterized protein n=1 Tax=Eumeta variegata TaxID=151549 RepID=A0A4C1Y5D8_EUMVA|nr:hypothetical protein EVAR_51019_1 [Eumeta japonica]